MACLVLPKIKFKKIILYSLLVLCKEMFEICKNDETIPDYFKLSQTEQPFIFANKKKI